MDEFDGSRSELEAREPTIGRPARSERTAPPSMPARADVLPAARDVAPVQTVPTEPPSERVAPQPIPPLAAPPLPPPRVAPLAPTGALPPVAPHPGLDGDAVARRGDLPTSRADLPPGAVAALARLAPSRPPDEPLRAAALAVPVAPPLAPTPPPVMPEPLAVPPAADRARPPPPAARPRRSPWRWAGRLAAGLAALLVAWALFVVAQVVVYRTVDPPVSNLMLLHRLAGEVVVQKWLPIEKVPAQLVRAIVVSEDGRFCSHNGIDFREIEAAIERARETDGTPRGASTITMQVAKNLFLWPSKSYVRKALEVPITLLIEALWTKRRIFEVYVNIAEWGPGVFGAEAAAGYHFGKSASRVSEREAALLAVALPNPVTRDAGDPGPGTERLASAIQARMRAMSRAAICIERPGTG